MNLIKSVVKGDKQKNNWLIDAGLFAGFLVAMVIDLTGIELHQWLGVAVTVVAVYHLLTHWQWVEKVTARFFGGTSGQARQYYVVDVGMAVGFVVILVTGLVISTWLEVPLASYPTWLDVHIYASIATLALVVLKLGIHWRWIVSISRRVFASPRPLVLTPVTVAARQSASPSRIGRREFVRLMGLVGLASAAATASALDLVGQQVEASANTSDPSSASSASVAAPVTVAATQTASPTVTSTAVVSATPTVSSPATATTVSETKVTPTSTAATVKATLPAKSTPTATVATSTSASQCVVQCDRECSYPGKCRRYVDKNANRLCDLGECL